VTLDVWMSSDNAQPRATGLPRLDWQGELDTAMADIDDRLTHPRRRASDRDAQPLPAELGNVPITKELLDEIAWRVAQQMRRSGHGGTTAKAVNEALTEARTKKADAALLPGKMVMIRFRWPELPWPFTLLRRFRKKQHPLTTARLRA
jgi:hypothetical protein